MSESLKAFIQYFNNEYPNFGGKPILERYKVEFDAFDNEFIDSRYYAFQSAWQHQQAKVCSLGEQVEEMQKRKDKIMRFIDWHIEDCKMTLWTNKDDYYTNGFEDALLLIKKYLKEKDVE